MPKSKGRRGGAPQRARATQAAQRAASQRKVLSLAQYRFRRSAGWSLVVVAVLMATVHWAGHLGAFGAEPSATLDLLAGYPMAGALGIAGAIVLSKT